MKIKDITIKKLKSGKLKKELSEFYELKNIIENNQWHNRESTFAHTLVVLDELQKFLINNKNVKLKAYLNKRVDDYARKNLLFLAIVFHDLGKKETIIKKGKTSTFPKHEEISIVKARKILEKFDLSKKEEVIVFGIIKYHSYLHAILDEDNKKLITQFKKIKKLSKNYFVELIVMVMVDITKSFLKTSNPKKYNFVMNFYKEILKRM